jgi:hypothetical protein
MVTTVGVPRTFGTPVLSMATDRACPRRDGTLPDEPDPAPAEGGQRDAAPAPAAGGGSSTGLRPRRSGGWCRDNAGRVRSTWNTLAPPGRGVDVTRAVACDGPHPDVPSRSGGVGGAAVGAVRMPERRHVMSAQLRSIAIRDRRPDPHSAQPAGLDKRVEPRRRFLHEGPAEWPAIATGARTSVARAGRAERARRRRSGRRRAGLGGGPRNREGRHPAPGVPRRGIAGSA